MSAEPAIDVTGLVKTYGSAPVLSGVDLRVPAGSAFALLGPNGAGKTTAVRIMATLAQPDSGRVRVAGYDVVADRAAVRRSIGLTGQYVSIDGMQTGRENLLMMASLTGLRGRAKRDRAAELLTAFGLDQAANRRVSAYSGGMRRKLDLAASLVRAPAVIFLDEPTTGLDPRGRQSLWEIVTELTSSGVTIFLTTQYLEEADRLADRIAILDGGQVVAEDSPAALKNQFTQRRLDLTFASTDAFLTATARLGNRVVRSDPAARTIGVAVGKTAIEVRRVLHELDPDGTEIIEFAMHTATLDDVFLALTGHPARTPDSPARHTDNTTNENQEELSHA